MNQIGRKQWWRAAAIAMLGGGVILAGWAGFSRSATTEVVAQDIVVAAAAMEAPAAPTSPVAAAPVPPAPVIPAQASPALPTIPAIPQVPVAPAVVPAMTPAEVTPVAQLSLPAIPIVPASAPPAIPSVEPAKTSTPVLLPPSIDAKSPPAVEPAPPPAPAQPRLSDGAAPASKTDSRLQGENTGNSVKPIEPIVPPPIAPPDLTKPVAPEVPVLPAIGQPSETPAKPASIERPKPIEPPLLQSGREILPTPNLTAPTPGDPTVKTLNQTVAAAVLGGVLFAPAKAAAQLPIPLPIQIDEKADIAKLKTDVEAANTKLGEIQKDLKQLAELLTGARDKEGFIIPTNPGLVTDIKNLTNRLKAVEEELSKMKGQSSSLRPGSTGAPSTPVDPRAGKGIVRIVNEYPVQISIVVNGTSYRVAPSKSLDIDVAAGEFTYQLLESGAAGTKSVIKEKETVTLRIK
jgi:outer membrane murein-binding lipoprotein Lpp